MTPTILILIGAATDELALLTVVGRRPLLALLLAAGSPSVHVSRAFEYRDPLEPVLLANTRVRRERGRGRPYRVSRAALSPRAWRAVAAAQYVLAAAAAANVALVSWQLGLGTVCAWWSNSTYGPLVWSLLNVPVNVAGALALRLRVRRVDGGADDDQHRHRTTREGGGGGGGGGGEETVAVVVRLEKWLRAMPRRLRAGLGRWEWVPGAAQAQEQEQEPATTGQIPIRIRVRALDERMFYVAWAWLLSTSTVMHITFGSLLLSGLLFIGPRDALGVIGRYMASVLVCRAVLMFELAGLRARYDDDIHDGDGDGDGAHDDRGGNGSEASRSSGREGGGDRRGPGGLIGLEDEVELLERGR